MKKLFLGMLIVLFTISSSFAEEINLEIKKIEQKLKWYYPRLTIIAIEKSPMQGIYEIWTGKDIFYTDGRFILIGAMFSPEGKVTEKRIAYYEAKYGTELEKKLNELDFTKGLKIGNGKTVIVEISDPQCPFCRKAENFFKGKSVSRYIFFMPLSFHKKAVPLAVHILCSKNPQEEYEKVMSGELDNGKLITCKEGEKKLKEMKKIADYLEAGGTPVFFIKTNDGWKKMAGANKKLVDFLNKLEEK